MANGWHASCRLPCRGGRHYHRLWHFPMLAQNPTQSTSCPRQLNWLRVGLRLETYLSSLISHHLTGWENWGPGEAGSLKTSQLIGGKGLISPDIGPGFSFHYSSTGSFQVELCMILHVLLHGNCLEQCLVHTKYWINIAIREKIKYPNSKV